MRLRTQTRGAALPLVLFLLTGLLGAAALAIDLSVMGLARQRAQAVADAAALAGASNPAAASVSAASVVSANNSVGAAFTSTSVTAGAGGAVTVRGTVNAPLSFAPAVGYAPVGADGSANTLSVTASATATLPPICGLPAGMPVAPFGVIGDDPANTDPAVVLISALLGGTKTLTPGAYQPASAQVMLRLNLWDQTGKLSVRGSFDPLLTSGVGKLYQSTISQLSDQPLTAGKVLTTPANQTLQFNNVSLTRTGIAARLAQSNTQFKNPPFPVVTYDAWYSAGQPQTDGHLMLIPIISQAVKDRPGNVTIIAFATFFISQPATDTTTNNIVYGRFLSLIVPTASGGTCNGAGSFAPAHLTQ